MGDLPAGAKVNDEGAVCNEDGSPDPLGRWVDNQGYIRVGVDGYDDYWRVTKEGQVVDPTGLPTSFTLTVPASFEIATNAVLDNAATGWLDEQAEDRQDGLSDRQAHSPSPENLAAFKDGITRTAATDAQGSDLTWAADQPLVTSNDLHGRALNPEFVGEDTQTGAFAANTMRGKSDPTGDNTQWTTNYDRQDTESVRPANAAGGLLVDTSGTPLTGQYGYVVDPSNGQFYTFDTGEGYVSKEGAWLSTKGLDRDQLIGLVQAALDANEQISFVHHSTALAGSPVAGAGHLTVADGRITAIDDQSGHYKPEGEYLWQTVTWLRAMGMPVDDIQVTMIAKGTEAQTILKGWQLAQTGGNQAQANLKAAANRELLDDVAAAEKAERVAGLQAQAVAPVETEAAKHFRLTGCDNLNPADAGDTRYCQSCDRDL